MIPNQRHLNEIEDLAYKYCLENNIIPEGHRLIISVSLEKSDFQVIAKSGPDLSLLRQDPRILWQKENTNLRFYGVKVADILDNNRITTMYDLAKRTRGEMLTYRKCGKKCLNIMEEWLKTFGLHFGMIFPDEIVAEFQENPSRQNITNSKPVEFTSILSLIQENLDNEALDELPKLAQDEEGTPVPMNDPRSGESKGRQIHI